MSDELRFDGQVAVVTGAGRGIGRSHAMLLAARGATVVVNDLGVDVNGVAPSAGPAREVVGEIEAAGGRALFDTSDVSTPAGAAGLIDAAIDTFGRVDVLIHNAGRNLGDFEPIMDVHVGAGHWMVERAWPGMVERSHGRIVLTTSAAGLYGDGTGPGPNPKQAYATAKAAVLGLTKALAIRGAPANIKVNAVSPTADTRLVGLNKGITNTRAGAPPPEATINWTAANAPARLVAAGTLWLLHDRCPVSGRLFAVGAGRVAEIFVGVTAGYISPSGELEPEDVLDHLEEVRAMEQFFVPVDLGDYGRVLRTLIPERGASTPPVASTTI